MMNDEYEGKLLIHHSSFRIQHFRSAVVADGFDGAGEERFFAERRLLVGLRLFEDEGVARSVGAREVGGRGVGHTSQSMQFVST